MPYALKVMYKGQIIAQEQVAHVMSEREVMSRCSHPFIVRMAASYQDGDALYMLLELVPGGELFSLLRQQSYFQVRVGVRIRFRVKVRVSVRVRVTCVFILAAARCFCARRCCGLRVRATTA